MEQRNGYRLTNKVTYDVWRILANRLQSWSQAIPA